MQKATYINSTKLFYLFSKIFQDTLTNKHSEKMKTTYTIKITGSGTAEEISQHLYEFAAHLYNDVHTIIREENNLNIERTDENHVLTAEITEE